MVEKRREVEGRPLEQIGTRFIGLSVPIPLHQEIREVARKQGMSATELYRAAIIQYLDRVKR